MFVVRIVRCLNELIGVRFCCKNCKVFESVDRSKVFVVRIVRCLNELIGVRCLL